MLGRLISVIRDIKHVIWGNLISSRRRYGIWNTIRGSLLGVLDDMRDDLWKAAPSRSISLLPSLLPSLGEDFCRFLSLKGREREREREREKERER